MSKIIHFSGANRAQTRTQPDPSADAQQNLDAAEIIVFPRTNIRVLRRMWGLPEYGLLIAGPDGRAVGALNEDTLAG